MEKQILELLIGLDSEVKGLKSEIGSLKSEMTGMKSEIGSMKSEMTSVKSEIGSLKSEMTGVKSEMHERFNGVNERFNTVDKRFDTVEGKLDGMGNQFELTNESRINEVDFLDNKVNRLEKEIFIMKSKSNR